MIFKVINFHNRRRGVILVSCAGALLLAPAAIIPLAGSGGSSSNGSLVADAIIAARDLIEGGAVHVAEAQAASILSLRKTKFSKGTLDLSEEEAGPPEPGRERTARRFIPRREQTPDLEIVDPLELLTPAYEENFLTVPPSAPFPESGGNVHFIGGRPPLIDFFAPPPSFSAPPPPAGVPSDLTPSSPVPEPGTWMMLIFGFGLLGALLRRTGISYGLSSRTAEPTGH